jgi:hypothetical protein
VSVAMDKAKLEAAGFTVEPAEGGYKIDGTLVRAHGESLLLAIERSAFHRKINAALGWKNPALPGTN